MTVMEAAQTVEWQAISRRRSETVGWQAIAQVALRVLARAAQKVG